MKFTIFVNALQIQNSMQCKSKDLIPNNRFLSIEDFIPKVAVCNLFKSLQISIVMQLSFHCSDPLPLQKRWAYLGSFMFFAVKVSDVPADAVILLCEWEMIAHV